jgi:sugar lactone lactonase YvrE
MTSDTPPTTRIRRASLLAAFLAVIAAVGVVWWRVAHLATPPTLPADWSATAVAIAGDGVSGVRDGDARRARFSDPFGVTLTLDQSIIVSDGGYAAAIRRISTDGVLTTIAGGGPGFQDGSGTEARFSSPSGLARAADGTIYVADTGNNAIRRVRLDGSVSTIAGDGTAGYRDGPGSQARFNGPIGLAIDRSGRVIVADTYNDRIRAIDPDGTVITLAGSLQGAIDGPAAQARFDTPCGVAVDDDGTIHIADTGNGVIRTLDPAGQVSTRLLGPEGLQRPIGIALGDEGTVVVSDERGAIVEIAASGVLRTLAGSTPGFHDGPGDDARFRRPAGIARVDRGRYVIADSGNFLVREIYARARHEPRLPASPLIRPAFDAAAFDRVPLLWPVAPMDGPHEIAGTIGEARGGDGAERFHAGIDVRMEMGTPVFAVRDGIVSSPIAAGDFDSLNEWLRVGPVTYVHVRAGRERSGRDAVLLDANRFVPTFDERGALIDVRLKRGARFSTGEPIATVNRFNHVHLNVGWPGEEHNPLRFRLAQYEDTVPPTIRRGGIQVLDDEGQPLKARQGGRLLVSGRVQIVVDAWDQSDGNRPGRRLGVYALGYEVLHRDGTNVEGVERESERIRFDRLAPDSTAARLVYAPGSGIPFYGRRVTRFLYTVTNGFRDGVAQRAFWDTTHVPPGDYIVRIVASDIRGNTALANRDLAVTIRPTDPAASGTER